MTDKFDGKTDDRSKRFLVVFSSRITMVFHRRVSEKNPRPSSFEITWDKRTNIDILGFIHTVQSQMSGSSRSMFRILLRIKLRYQ